MLIESLESRQLRSVSVQPLPGHGLYIRGTSGADNVIIVQSDKTVVVADAVPIPDSTGITPDPKYSEVDPVTGEPLVPIPVYSDISYILVDLGAGNDHLVYIGGVSARAGISMGNGDDIADVQSLSDDATLVLDLGNGADQLFVASSGSSLLVGSGGNGADAANIVVSENARVIYSAGAGNDTAILLNTGSAANQLIYDGGSGFDTVSTNLGSAIITRVESTTTV